MPEITTKKDNQVLTQKSAVRKFFDLQSRRVEAYNMLDRSFEDYLKTAPQYNFEEYKKMVHNITERFNELSSEILSIISFLESEKDCDQVVKCIKSVQEIEAEKLSLTRDSQIQRKSINDDEGDEKDLEETKKRMQVINERITTVLEDLKYEAEDILTS